MSYQDRLTIALTIIVLILLAVNMQKYTPSIPTPEDILLDPVTRTIYLGSMTTEQKIAQMMISFQQVDNPKFLQNTLIGGVLIGAHATAQEFKKATRELNDGAIIPMFIAADMEGCINPFEAFKTFPSIKDIETKEQAYQIGIEHGQLLTELGFNFNFAPVVDLEDNIWNCRSFQGTPQEISEKANAYINGLKTQGIKSTVKHYPGMTLSSTDPHEEVSYATISKEDLIPFKETMQNTSAIMVSHIIVNGEKFSELRPSVVSQRIVEELRKEFDGLIIADSISMLGLKDYYQNEHQMFIDLITAGNDLIIVFNTEPYFLYTMFAVIQDAINRGEINESTIDDSVTRILEAKGFNVINS